MKKKIPDKDAPIRDYKNPTLCKTCIHILEKCDTIKKVVHNSHEYGIVVSKCDGYKDVREEVDANYGY